MRTLLSLFLALPLCAQYVATVPATASGGGSNVFTPVSNAIVSSTPSGTMITTVLTNNPATGDMVVIGCATYNNGSATAPTMTVSDANSNAYTVITGTGIPAGGFSPNNYNGWVLEAWLPSAPSNASKTIIATLSNTTGGFGYCFPQEASYTGPTPTLDNSIGMNGTTTCSLPTINVSVANEFVYSIATVNGSMAGITSGLTEIGAVQSTSWAAGYNASVSSNLTPVWNLSSGCGGSSYILGGVGASFK